jgi:hypothetical protein
MKIPKGRAIRQSHYSLEALSLSQGRPNGVLTPGVGQLPKSVKRRVAPLDAQECVMKGMSRVLKRNLNQQI